MPSPRRRTVFALLAAAAVLLGACSDGDSSPAAEAPPSAAAVTAAAGAVQSPASILRANLTSLLQEHVYLTGATTATVVAGQDPSSAAAVVDTNSVALSNVIGSVYGLPTAEQFLGLWRRHIALLVEFARSSAAVDEPALAAAKAALEAYKQEMAVFLNTTNPNLAEEAMVEDQDTYLSGLQSVVTAQVEAAPTAPVKLKTAAEHMPRMAAVLVAGITKDHPDMFQGTFDGSAATLRSVFAANLQEHAYLSWFTAGVVAAGGDSKDAVAAVDENSVELANVLGSAYGDEAASGFLELWRAQVSSYVDYAQARAAGDAAGAQAAASRLADEPAKVGAFLHAANSRFDQATLTAELTAHSRSLLAAIDSLVSAGPTRFADIHAVAGRTPGMATRLSTGIASQFPSRFS